MVNITVTDKFDGGNIQFLKTRVDPNDADTPLQVILQIKPDIYTELEQMAHMQYFLFQVTVDDLTSSSQRIKYVIENADQVSYPEAWPGTTVCYSTSSLEDVDSWKRVVDTFYTEGHLWWTYDHTMQNGSVVYFGFFPPFSYDRHCDLIAKCGGKERTFVLGQTLDGRPIDCVKIGSGSMTCWIIHRQHPGETQAEHFAEGLLTRLLGLESKGVVDAKVKKILSLYTFYIVPNMNPDGSIRGHLRTNAAGANLNREWAPKGDYDAPTLERSPEVYWVLKKMDETGVDAFLDIHADEELPYNFTMGPIKIPKWGPRLQSLHGAFTAAYARANSDMQKKYGYPSPETEAEVLDYMNVGTNQVAERFDCLALTLEMPFKDCWSNRDPERGWSPARSRKLGASVLEPLEYIHPYLRAEGEFWKKLPSDDAFVEPTDDYQNEMESATEEFVMLKKRFYSDVHEWHKAPVTK